MRKLIPWIVLILVGCGGEYEETPEPSKESTDAQAKAIEAEKSAITNETRILEEVKTKLPIPKGPDTIDVPADMNDLDAQIMGKGN